MFEGDGFEELGLDEGDDGVFVGFGVGDGDGVVVLENYSGVAGRPDAEHGGVYDICQGALGIVRNSFSQNAFVISSAPELTFAPSKRSKSSSSAELRVNVVLPLLVGGEGSEVLGLELLNDPDRKLGLCTESCRLATIVTSVSEFFAHKSVCVMSIIRLFCDILVSLKIIGPRKFWPTNSCNGRMNIPRLNSIEVLSVIEKVPFDCADAVALSGLRVELGELHSRIGDEDRTERLFNILEVASSSKLRKARTPAASRSTSNIVASSKSSIGVNARFEDGDLFAKIPHGGDVVDDLSGDEVLFHLLEGFTVDGDRAAALDGRDGELVVEKVF